jgi:hypothetical protein
MPWQVPLIAFFTSPIILLALLCSYFEAQRPEDTAKVASITAEKQAKLPEITDCLVVNFVFPNEKFQ